MSHIQTDKDTIFTRKDCGKPRMVAEDEKLKKKFSDFRFSKKGNRMYVRGKLRTNIGNTYKVKITIPYNYPFILPDVYLPETVIDTNCTHKYGTNKICFMRPEHWSSIFSLAMVVGYTARWLNKYDLWLKNGKGDWPGNDGHRK